VSRAEIETIGLSRNGFLVYFAKQKAIELAKTAGKYAVDKGT
jgi:hypothetical protein